MQINILAMGEGWLAVDKPVGLSVHNVPGADLCSFLSDTIREDVRLKGLIGYDDDFGIHPVHRLDKETSGVILLAVNRRVFRYFSSRFESGKMRKYYVALVHGRLDRPEGADGWGAWNWELSKTAGGRDNPRGPKPRLPSESRYRVLGHSAHYTMVEIELLSGRKHQIRRHAKLAGHPVVGDARYGSTRAVNYLKRNAGFERLALHARSLSFGLPEKKGERTVETEGIPEQMRALFEGDDKHPGRS